MSAHGWLRGWLPAIFWAGVIWILSTEYFSAQRTSAILQSVAEWFLPWLTRDELDLINLYLRKSAHFTEYFIFCLLLFRGWRGGRRGWRWTWALGAFVVAAGYSALDEIHQAFVIERTASVYDSLLDSTGAFAAMLAGFGRAFAHHERPPRRAGKLRPHNTAWQRIRCIKE